MIRIDIDFKLIGERIKNERIKKGWSQERLSAEIHVTSSYINKIEKGGDITLKKLAKISKVLEIQIEQLILGTSPMFSNYLDKDLYQLLIKCTPAKQKFIYNIAKIVSEAQFL